MTAPGAVHAAPPPAVRSPVTAATLSALLPGLGQLAERRPGRALAWAIPVVATTGLLAAFGASALAGDSLDLGLGLIQPEVLVAILLLDAVLVVHRFASAADAYAIGRTARGTERSPVAWRGRLAAAGLAVVLVATASFHIGIAAADLVTLRLVTAVFDPGGASGDEAILPPEPEPSPSPSPAPVASPDRASPSVPEHAPGGLAEPSPGPSPSPSPAPTPRPSSLPAWARDGRLDLLLVGTDAGPDRWKLRTDTMILLSVDVASGRAALFGIPRNLVNVPLPAETADLFECHCFPNLINGLWVYADGHPDQFPGGRNRGWRAVAGAISALTGAHLDGLVVVDLQGFVDAVDALGGLRIHVPALLVDDRYPKPDGSGTIAIRIEPGWHTFDGAMALAYARSRHQDSDYGRMHRQQQVLLALRAQARPCRLIGRLPSLLPVIERSVWTTLRTRDLPDLLELAARVDAGKVATVTFTPSAYPQHLRPTDVERIRAVVRDIFRQTPDAAPTPSLEALPDGC